MKKRTERIYMSEKIIWIDVETTGLNPLDDSLLEITAHLTDMSGQSLAEEYKTILFDCDPSVTHLCDPFVLEMHEKSGLWDDLWSHNTVSYDTGDTILHHWLSSLINDDDIVYFGGNSIRLDRNFVEYYLPKFNSLIHYRSIDVTSISLVWNNLHTPYDGVKKNPAHRSEDDIRECIQEYRRYTSLIKKSMNNSPSEKV